VRCESSFQHSQSFKAPQCELELELTRFRGHFTLWRRASRCRGDKHNTRSNVVGRFVLILIIVAYYTIEASDTQKPLLLTGVIPSVEPSKGLQFLDPDL